MGAQDWNTSPAAGTPSAPSIQTMEKRLATKNWMQDICTPSTFGLKWSMTMM